MARLARVSAAALCALLASCLQGRWTREIEHVTVDEQRVANLRPGHSDLGACLAELGAPLFVWEHRGDGLAIAYGAQRSRDFGIGVSVPVSDSASASFDYDERSAEVPGYILFFDADWNLTAVERGALRDFAITYARQPAAALDE